MNRQFKKSLFVFRRDFRLVDNTGLIYALEHSEVVIPCFIFTPEQIENNPYRSDHCLQFMIESLQDLDKELKKRKGRLYLFYGPAEDIIEQSIRKLQVKSVIVNKDYTPFSQARDKKIATICKMLSVDFLTFDDLLLHLPEDTLKQDGTPYKIFTPYYRQASRHDVALPKANERGNYFHGSIEFSFSTEIYIKILPQGFPHLAVKGGRTSALKIIKHIENFSSYATERDYPALHGTTLLSAYLKFTLFSPREIYHAIVKNLGKQHELIRSLFWRDFFSTIAFFFPHVFQGSFYQKFDQLEWKDDPQAFQQWCCGKTGFPIVDAGMRELNETGFMHNRVRMIVASFLTKDLHLNWRWGEKYFAQKLIDYDPAVNNGNWQWSASTGCDAQPYFRVFNPWVQQKKFDRDCIYIKQWVPKLKNLSSKMIHEWYNPEFHPHCPLYPPPMVDHEHEAKTALMLYRAVRT